QAIAAPDKQKGRQRSADIGEFPRQGGRITRQPQAGHARPVAQGRNTILLRKSQVRPKLAAIATSLAKRGSAPAMSAPPTIAAVSARPMSAEITNRAFC